MRASNISPGQACHLILLVAIDEHDDVSESLGEVRTEFGCLLHLVVVATGPPQISHWYHFDQQKLPHHLEEISQCHSLLHCLSVCVCLHFARDLLGCQ